MSLAPGRGGLDRRRQAVSGFPEQALERDRRVRESSQHATRPAVGARRVPRARRDPRRLLRHAAHAPLLRPARAVRRDDLRRSRAGRRQARRAPRRRGGARADPRAHAHRSGAARAAAQAQADQPTQRLPAHRRGRVHRARRDRVVEPARRYAVVRGGRTHLGAGDGGDAAAAAADGRAQARRLADRRRSHAARQDARDLRLGAHRPRGGGLRQGVRHGGARVGAAGVDRAGARRGLAGGARQADVLRGVRRAVAPHAPRAGDTRNRHRRRPLAHETVGAPGQHEPRG